MTEMFTIFTILALLERALVLAEIPHWGSHRQARLGSLGLVHRLGRPGA